MYCELPTNDRDIWKQIIDNCFSNILVLQTDNQLAFFLTEGEIDYHDTSIYSYINCIKAYDVGGNSWRFNLLNGKEKGCFK